MASFIDPSTGTSRLSDDFDDGSIGLDQTPNNGTISETGGNLLLTVAGAHDWDYNSFDAPLVHKTIADLTDASSKLIRVYSKTDPTACSGLNSGQHFGVTLWKDQDNGYRLGPYSTRDIRFDVVLPSSTATRGSVSNAAPTDWLTDTLEMVLYYNPTAEIIRTDASDIEFLMPPNYLVAAYRINAGSWTYLSLDELEVEAPTKVGLVHRRWSSGTSVAAFTEIDIQTIEKTGTLAPVQNDPSTTFDFTSLPKYWSFFSCNDATEFPDVGLTLDNPGISIDYTNFTPLAGLMLSGVGFSSVRPDFDIELVIENFEKVAGGGTGGYHSLGVVLMAPSAVMEQNSPNGTSFIGAFRGESAWLGNPYYYGGDGVTSGPDSSWASKRGTVARPGGITQDRIRFCRVGLRNFYMFYYSGSEWVLVAYYTGSSMNPAGELDNRLFDYLRLAVLADVDSSSGGDQVQGTVSELKVHAGELTPFLKDLSDDFSDNVFDKEKHVPFTTSNIYSSGHRYIVEQGDSLEWTNLSVFWIDDQGYFGTQTLYPGTDIDLIWHVIDSYQTAANYQVYRQEFGFYNESRRKNEAAQRTHIYAQVERRDTVQNGRLYTYFYREIDNVRTQIGVTYVTLLDTPPQSHTYSIRLTRSGNVWEAFYNATSLGTWTDTDGRFTDWPINHYSQMTNHAEQTAPTFALTAIELATGDYDSGLYREPPQPPGPSVVATDEIRVVASNLIRVAFTGSVAFETTAQNVSNYVVTNLSGGEAAEVVAVLPIVGKYTSQIWLSVSNLTVGDQYRLQTTSVLRDVDGDEITVSGTWRQTRTKVDLVRSSLSQSYDLSESSVLGKVVEALMISDEEIGGDF